VKIVIIGGGSTHTPELARGLLERLERIGLRELWLVDADPARLDAVGGFVARMVEHAGTPFRVRCSTQRKEAMEGADFVIVQIRVGGLAARREDESLCRRWRLIDHESTGVGGMASAFRTVPVLLSMAEEMRARCPDAWLINITNPSGLVVEALQKQVPDVRSVGISEGAVGTRMMVAEELGVSSPLDVQLDYLGLNHLAWIRGARTGGEDVWKKVFSGENPDRSGNVIVRLGLIWDYYLQTASQRQGLPGDPVGEGPTPVERLMAEDRSLLSRYADASGGGLLPERAGTGEGRVSLAVAQVIEAMVLDQGQEHILNTRHLDAVQGLPGEWVLEMPCRVFRDRVEPLPAEPLPVVARGLLEVVKSSELLAVEAALSGSWSSALAALLAHPLGPDADHAGEVLNDLLDRHRDHTPGFQKE
jgi:6-phospho-beta-glucosidase